MAVLLHGFLWVVCLVIGAGCASTQHSTRQRERALIFSPQAFRAELKRRVPDLPDRLASPPYVLDADLVARGEAHMLEAPIGPARVQALVDFLSLPAPDGLGLVYDWAATGSASATLEAGRGNCVSLAAVLVALGRGLEWPIYFAEARTRRPQTQEFEEVTAVSDHMVVLIAAKTFKTIVDFTGQIAEAELEDLRPIDDLTAYAHIINNMSAQRLMIPGKTPTEADWQLAKNGFRLATRIDPELGRSWNNLGIALTRLHRFEEAREAYERAVALDTAFGSARRNLVTMETRASGDPSVQAAAIE